MLANQALEQTGGSDDDAGHENRRAFPRTGIIRAEYAVLKAVSHELAADRV
jgi:hypothetical protein